MLNFRLIFRFKNDRNYTFTLQKLSNNRDTDVVAERGDHFEELGV